jgi:hypothetical protein
MLYRIDKRKQQSSKKGEKSSHESPIKHHRHRHHHHHNHSHHHDRKRQKPLTLNDPLTSNDNNQEDHKSVETTTTLVQRYYNNQNQLIETSFVPQTHLSSMSSKFNQTGVSSSSSNDITSSLWGPPRIVVLQREPNKSLGIHSFLPL